MTAKIVSFVGKIGGQEVKGNLLSDQDIVRLNDTRTRVKSLETKVDELHKFTRKLATQDFFTTEANKDSMQAGVIYLVGFKDDGSFIAPNPNATPSKFWPNGEPPAYFEMVMLTDDGTILKLGREKYTSSLDDAMSKTYDNEYKGQLTHLVEQSSVSKAAGLTKFNFVTAAANPSVQVTTGHIAQDQNGVSLFSHTGAVDTDGTRRAELVVNKSDGGVAGKVSLSSSSDGATVSLAIPQPTSPTPADNEAATVKFVQDAIDAKPNFIYQTDKPTDTATIDDGVLIFFDAIDLIQE